MSVEVIVEPDWETWELPVGGLAGEILTKWGGHGGDIERVVEFVREAWSEDPAWWSSIWSKPASRITAAERRRVGEGWDRFRAEVEE